MNVPDWLLWIIVPLIAWSIIVLTILAVLLIADWIMHRRKR